MNPILCPFINGKRLTMAAHRTFMAQDIPVEILYINNACTEDIIPWLSSLDVHTMHNASPMSVAQSWNAGLQYWFRQGAEHVLVVNNDVELRPDTYRKLLEDGGGFVTAVSVIEREKLLDEEDRGGPRPHPDFSCYLISREVYFKVGEFDENFKVAYHEDNDYHLRLHRAGVFAHCIDLPFYHAGAATINASTAAEQEYYKKAAHDNSLYFNEKYGFFSGTDEYYAEFKSPSQSE